MTPLAFIVYSVTTLTQINNLTTKVGGYQKNRETKGSMCVDSNCRDS